MVVDCAPNGVAYIRDLDPKNYSVLLALGPRETLAIEIMCGKYLLRPRNSIWGPRFEKNVRSGGKSRACPVEVFEHLFLLFEGIQPSAFGIIMAQCSAQILRLVNAHH